MCAWLVALQGTDVDACYDAAFWNSFDGTFPASHSSFKQAYDIRFFRQVTPPQVQALRSDMCGWRMVAKRGYLGALRGAINSTLQVREVELSTGWAGAMPLKHPCRGHAFEAYMQGPCL
jgi:hypothetical protein